MTEKNGKNLDLPKGWILSKIREVCTKPQYGYTTKAAEEGTIKLLRTTDITSGKINWYTVPFCLENPSEPEKYLLKDGDIVISRAGSIGFNYLITNPKYSVFASYLIRFRCKDIINKHFFKLFLESPLYWQNISEKKLGIAVSNINATKLQEIELPIPPLPEQQRIVDKIEELFSELDNGVESLKKSLKQLKLYRQAVLKWAFEGKLTEAWRSEHEDTLEDAQTLLTHIKAEREGHYQKKLEEWKKAVKDWEANGKNGKKPTKPQMPNELPPLTKEELSELPNLPDGWCWVKIGQPYLVFVGSTPSRKEKNYWDGEINWVSSGEVSFCKIYSTKEKITQLGLENSSTEIHPIGTVMLGMIGEGKTRGQAAILMISAAHNQNTAAIRVGKHDFSSKLLYYYFYFQYEKTRSIGSGNNQKALNKARVENIKYPLSSLQEQSKIVQEIESRLSICDQLEATIIDNFKKAEALRQSILKRAFEGKLVPQNPDDEPASELLKRIQAEKSDETSNNSPKQLELDVTPAQINP